MSSKVSSGRVILDCTQGQLCVLPFGPVYDCDTIDTHPLGCTKGVALCSSVVRGVVAAADAAAAELLYLLHAVIKLNAS